MCEYYFETLAIIWITITRKHDASIGLPPVESTTTTTGRWVTSRYIFGVTYRPSCWSTFLWRKPRLVGKVKSVHSTALDGRLCRETFLGNNDTKMTAHSRGHWSHGGPPGDISGRKSSKPRARLVRAIVAASKYCWLPFWTYSEDFCCPWRRHCASIPKNDDFMRGGMGQPDVLRFLSQ